MGNRSVTLTLWMYLCGFSLLGCTALQPINPAPDEEPIAAPPTAIVESHVNADWTNVQSRSEDGLAMLGNPDATVTFIDYSDFL